MTTSINKYMLAAMVVAMAACSSPDITENTVGTPLRKCTLEVEPVSRLVFNTDADGNPLTNLVWSPDDMITIVDDETGTQTMSMQIPGRFEGMIRAGKEHVAVACTNNGSNFISRFSSGVYDVSVEAYDNQVQTDRHHSNYMKYTMLVGLAKFDADYNAKVTLQEMTTSIRCRIRPTDRYSVGSMTGPVRLMKTYVAKRESNIINAAYTYNAYNTDKAICPKHVSGNDGIFVGRYDTCMDTEGNITYDYVYVPSHLQQVVTVDCAALNTRIDDANKAMDFVWVVLPPFKLQADEVLIMEIYTDRGLEMAGSGRAVMVYDPGEEFLFEAGKIYNIDGEYDSLLNATTTDTNMFLDN
ncbi:MAG: hypothetical protein IKA70_05485 [Alistipes sp.]|nr:hypothetical protein [Alistipes sp.]